MRVVVIGGTGLIGSKLVHTLNEHGHDAVAAAPSTGVNTLTGEGLPEVLAGAQVVVDGRDSESWMGLARALLAIQVDPDKESERYDLPVNASGAAYIAYERAQNDDQKARALAVLGDALQRRSYWRPAIDALKTSLALADNQSVRQTYDKLRAEHGFTGVRHDHRGRGIALMLKRRCLAWAAENGIAEVITWTQERNDGMRAVNEKLGFEYRLVSRQMTRAL